jgi:berberine-like enzyme
MVPGHDRSIVTDESPVPRQNEPSAGPTVRCRWVATRRGRVLDLGLRWCRRPGSRGRDRVPGSHRAVWDGTETQWDDPADDCSHREWARTGIGLIEPCRLVGGYVNDVSEAGDDTLVRSVYGEAKYERLRALKRAWDPDNVFRLNQNIRP